MSRQHLQVNLEQEQWLSHLRPPVEGEEAKDEYEPPQASQGDRVTGHVDGQAALTEPGLGWVHTYWGAAVMFFKYSFGK